MSWIRKILGLKGEPNQIIVEEAEESEETGFICDYCKMAIHEGQRVKTYGGKKFHLKPCWYRLRKDAKALI